MKIPTRSDISITPGTPRENAGKSSGVDGGVHQADRLRSLKTLKPFKGDLRAGGIGEILRELFEAARMAAESGRIMPRGSFLNIVV
ncbi:hypothetical protein O4H49_16485 [Kiloniella laminariae]|uniref:Uncharacterized protein n=1 Tax=Kiloniella laminariae TaxID=454162 RepID=A0ABT4LMQ0_9PROT|nr:hypothetical protein [Kiloniella laminariae]MCZ4282386.1 hypothetical protein [Kiloniella laminariae]